MLKKLKTYYFLILVVALCVMVDVIAQSDAPQIDKGNDLSTELTIYPNPATEYFTLQTDVPVLRITVNDLTGKQIKLFTADDTNTYDVSDLKKGIYIVRVFGHGDQLIKPMRLSKS